jgi:hypothetical protein
MNRRRHDPAQDVPAASPDQERNWQVPTEAFDQFERWMDEQLATLEARWAAWAAPRAGRERRIVHPAGQQSDTATGV